MATRKLTAQSIIAMPETQRDALVEKYEAGVDESEFRPMTPAQRKRWQKSVRETKALRRKHSGKQGRPVVGHGAKVISVSVERTLLARADKYAKTHSIKRAQLIAVGLELAMKRVG